MAASARELLELVGLGDAREIRVAAMSKGMQQRLGIAQALVGSPRVLLLDEPTSALDPVGRRVVRDLLGEVRARGIAVMLSSHLLSEVELVCDRVAILVGGQIVAQGTPAELARPRGVEVETAEGAEDVPRRSARGRSADRGRHRHGRRTGVRGQSAGLHARGRLPRGGRRGVSSALVIARYALREAVRRRVILVVLLLTVGFLALYGLGCQVTFDQIEAPGGPDEFDERVLAGATLVGLSMFTTLFLGAVLAVFLTLGAVRGDAERGLLQPLVVRPVGRTQPPARAVRRRRGGLRGVRGRRLHGGGADHGHPRGLVA